MSLINEALKKAQRMRHQDAPGAPATSDSPAGPSQPPAASMPLRRGRTPGSQTFALVAGVALLLVASVGTTWWLLRPTPADDPPAVASAATPAPAVRPVAESAPTPTATSEAQPAAAPEPLPTPASPAITPATPTPDAAGAATPTIAASTPAAPSPAPTADGPQAARPDPRVHAFLDTLRVTGIRASATDPRVSMNDRVFRLNDIVDRNLELRIIGIAPEGLTFIGPNGVVYQTQF